MQTDRGWVLINGQLPYWGKSLDGLDAVLRAARDAGTPEAWDEVAAAFDEACQRGALSRVEAEVALRAMDRALTRVQGPAAGASPAAEGKAGGYGDGGLEYGAAVPGVRLVK